MVSLPKKKTRIARLCSVFGRYQKGGYTLSTFLNMYLGVLHKLMRGNTRCYGNCRTLNLIVLLVFVGNGDNVQVNIRRVVVFVGSNTRCFFFTYISYDTQIHTI